MKKLLLLSVLSACVFFSLNTASSQNISDYEFEATLEAYEEIAGGQVISNSTTVNNQFFSNISIGFDFLFAGQTYSEIGVSTNGFASFSNASDNNTYPLFQNINNSISPLSGDLEAQIGASISYLTEGTAPNRIFTVQWRNYKWNGLESNYNFQLKLYETSNIVDFHYGDFNHNENQGITQVSINRNNADFQNRILFDLNNSYNLNDPGSGFWINNTSVPTNGLKYRFVRPQADLNLNIFPDVASLCTNQEFKYTIEVTNNSSNFSTENIETEFNIPSNLTYISSNSSKGSYNSSTGLYSVGDLARNETAVLEVIVKVNTGTEGNSIEAVAEIINANLYDPDVSNNGSTVNLSVGNNSSPQLSDITNQNAPYNGISAPIPFTISDAETSADDLVISVTSSNQTLLPNGNISVNGSDENRELILQPAFNQFGTAAITVEVSDGTCPIIKTFEVEVFKQSFNNFEAANIVVGQPDFTSGSTTPSSIVGPGSNSSAVSVKGVLAVGSQTTHRVLIWNSVPTSNGAPANVVLGQHNFNDADAGTSQSRLSAPDGVAFSPDGNKLIVADAGNNRILIWNSIPTTNFQGADVVLGQSNFTDNGSGTSATRFNRPTDIQFTASGKMIVTDRNNDRVLIYNKIPTQNNTPADLVIGQSDFASGFQGIGPDRLRTPWNTSVSPEGKLLIADDGNNRVLVYNSVPTTNGAAADLVIGQNDFFSGAAGSSDDGFSSPGVTVSPNGIVAVADFNNHRALIFNEIPTINGAAADVVLGQRNFNENIRFNDGNGQTGPPSAKNMDTPYGINFDLNERLYINGRGMNRMMIFGETPTQVSDLSIAFTSDSNTPCVNSLVTYEVNVTNNGPNSATNVVVTSALPSGFTPVDSDAQRGIYNEGSGYWRIPLIENGETITLTMRGTVNAGQNLNSISAYASLRSYNQNDSDFSNNSGSVTINVLDNEAPSISGLDDVILDLNTASPNINFIVNDANVNANTLDVIATSSDQALVKDESIALGGGGANRFLQITPENGQFGVVTISVTVDDGTCSTTESFELFVGNVWLGNTTVWDAANNWSAGVPTEMISAVIPNNPLGGSLPVINGTADVNNLIIEKNANININAGQTLNVHGNFTNLGSSYTGNGNLRMNGNTSQWLRGLVSGLVIDNISSVSLADNLITERSINLINGQLIVGDNSLSIRNPLTGNPQNLIMDGTSSLIVKGTAAGISIPSSISVLEDIELENGSGLALTNKLQINDSLKLYAGRLDMGANELDLLGLAHSTNGTLSSNDGASLSISSTGDAGKIVYDNASNELSNLSINVTSGSFEIENTVVINDHLNLVAGKLVSTNGFIHVNNSGQSALSVSTDAYIAGTLRRCVTTGIDYALPIGSLDHKEAVEIKFNSMSESSCIDVFFNVNNSNPSFVDIADLNLSVGGNPVEQVLDYGYWTINPTNSTGVYNYDLSVTSQGHLNGNESGHHILLKREDSSSDWEILGEYSSENEGGSFTDAITVSRANLTGFSDFAVGASSMGPLPVELISFEAEQKQNGVLLEWSTASEKNNSHFEVQKSSDGIDFVTIGMVAGNGNSSNVKKYDYRDYGTHGNVSYYRLQQFDFDGKSELSDIVKVHFESRLFNINLYPNPASDQITVNFDQKVGNAVIQFVNSSGQIVKKERKTGGNSMNIDISELEKGYYQIIIWSQTEKGIVSSNSKLLKN